MKSVSALLFVLLLGVWGCRTVDAKLKILKTVMDVVSFGMDVYSFFDSKFGSEQSPTPQPVDYDSLINSISERIEMSTETIALRNELQTYISELRNIALIIKQLLSEVDNIIKSKTCHVRKEYQGRFQIKFEKYEVELYKIESVLTFKVNIPGFSGTLLSLIAKEYDCELSRLRDFQTYYMALVSDVVALALLNEKFSDKCMYNATLVNWQMPIKSLFGRFKEQNGECTEFFGQAKKDFDNIDDPIELFEHNQRKYPHQINDVLYLGGSYCVWSLKHYDTLFKKEKGNIMTYQFIGSNENFVKNDKEQQEKIASTTKFENCKADTGKIIIYFNFQRQDLIFWLMFPQHESTDVHILRDQNSPASMITAESGNTKYTVVIYLRAQDDNSNTPLTASDFDVEFYAAAGGLTGMRCWQLGLIISSSILAVLIKL